MQDYQALISHLRECHCCDPSENTFSAAADAIEELLAARSARPVCVPLETRTLPEMIRYAYKQALEMDIPQEQKQQVLGMIMAIDEKAASENMRENAICAPGIWIEYTDAPITAACKLATATRTVKPGPLSRAVRAAIGQEPEEEYTVDVFSCGELRELAEHLLTYAQHNQDPEELT